MVCAFVLKAHHNYVALLHYEAMLAETPVTNFVVVFK
jgi:hypothetical protein